MGAAAGADVEAGDLHDAHRPGQRPLGAVRHLGQLLRGRIPALDGQIGPHRAVGFDFDRSQVLRRDHAVKVNGDPIRAHVETGVMVTIPAVDNAGNDMLAAVLLHPQEAAGIVDDALHRRAHLQGAAAQVHHRFTPLPGIQHGHATKGSGIGGLSAALGVKGRGIQDHFEALVRFFAGKDGGREPGQVGIFVIEFPCFHGDTSYYRKWIVVVMGRTACNFSHYITPQDRLQLSSVYIILHKKPFTNPFPFCAFWCRIDKIPKTR